MITPFDDGLVTMTESSSETAFVVTHHTSFTISDNNDVAKARTRDFHFGVKFVHSSGEMRETQRRILYTNPCDSASFFSAVTSPIIEIKHIPGKYD